MICESGALPTSLSDRSKRTFTAWHVVPPVLVWALAMVLVRLTAVAAGFAPFDRHLLVRWDSSHYMNIAKGGYQFYPSDGTEDFPIGTWMGNAGWMPGYALLMRPFVWMGVPTDISGTAISALFTLATLVLLWRLILRQPIKPTVAVLWMAGFFPATIYSYAVFPMSMATCFAVIALDALSRGRWWRAGVASALMSFSYATGFLMSVVAILWVIVGPRNLTWRERAKGVLVAGSLPWLGLATVCVIHQILFARWNAFFLVQAKFGHGIHNPLTTLLTSLHFFEVQRAVWFGAGVCLLTMACLAVAAITLGIQHWRTLSDVEQVLLIYLIVFWMFPLIMGPQVSPWRSTILLLPTVCLATRLPPAVCWFLAGLFWVVGVSVAVLFFRANII